MKTGIELIAEERQRQIEVEGWTLEHDTEHIDESIAYVAACYTIPPNGRNMYAGVNGLSNMLRTLWPRSWDFNWWKPSPENRVKELQKAGALIAAEIDRLQSLSNSTVSPKPEHQNRYEVVKETLQDLVYKMENTLKLMPTKGNTSSDCQRTNLACKLNELSNAVAGIELEDFTPNEYSGDFKFTNES